MPYFLGVVGDVAEDIMPGTTRGVDVSHDGTWARCGFGFCEAKARAMPSKGRGVEAMGDMSEVVASERVVSREARERGGRCEGRREMREGVALT